MVSRSSVVSMRMRSPLRTVGLFPEPNRTDSGYRQYSEKEVHTLRFIRQARDLGFSLEQIADLLALWQNRRRPSRQVKALAEAHIKELEQKLQEIQVMKATLEHLVHCCHGDDRPDCPILETLSDENLVVPTAPKPNGGSAKRGLHSGSRH